MNLRVDQPIFRIFKQKNSRNALTADEKNGLAFGKNSNRRARTKTHHHRLTFTTHTTVKTTEKVRRRGTHKSHILHIQHPGTKMNTTRNQAGSTTSCATQLHHQQHLEKSIFYPKWLQRATWKTAKGMQRIFNPCRGARPKHAHHLKDYPLASWHTSWLEKSSGKGNGHRGGPRTSTAESKPAGWSNRPGTPRSPAQVGEFKWGSARVRCEPWMYRDRRGKIR